MTEQAWVLSELARVVATEPVTDPLPVRLCRACASILDADGAAITLSGDRPERVVLCVTDEVASRLEDLQEVLADGPSLTAFRTGQAAEVVLGREEASRPPTNPTRFSESASELFGPLSVYAVPIHLGRPAMGVIGALMLYQRRPRAVRHGMEVAQFLANAVGAALLRHAGPAVGGGEADDDSGPWSTRAAIHQATGMVLAQLGLSPQDALALLRAHAYAHDLSLEQIAQQVIHRRLDFTTTDPDGSPPR